MTFRLEIMKLPGEVIKMKKHLFQPLNLHISSYRIKLTDFVLHGILIHLKKKQINKIKLIKEPQVTEKFIIVLLLSEYLGQNFSNKYFNVRCVI